LEEDHCTLHDAIACYIDAPDTGAWKKAAKIHGRRITGGPRYTPDQSWKLPCQYINRCWKPKFVLTGEMKRPFPVRTNCIRPVLSQPKEVPG